VRASDTNIAEEIKSRANIVDVIGRTVHLKRTGSGYVGLCPFHNEKTPSFSVSESRQSFHCFGCGASGDVISFYEKLHNLNFMEASEKLAGEYGIEWKPGGDTDRESKKSIYYAINKAAARFFYDAIRKPKNPALSYMADRGVFPETIKTFGIGYADNRENSLVEYLREQNLPLEKAQELGLLVKRQSGEYRDMFLNRVMFPIINTREKVIAFGGRDLTGNARAKYLNSPESLLFHKRENLYALNLVKDAMVKGNTGILVEGYMDVVSLFQNGFRNVTAALGTALTSAQARMLKRYVETMVLAYDMDSAGVAATLRSIDVIRDVGLSGRVLSLKGAKDPDEYVQKNGQDELSRALAEAIPFMDFKLMRIAENYEHADEQGNLVLDEEARVAFLRDAVTAIREDVRMQRVGPVEVDFYIKKMARDTSISAEAIHEEIYGKQIGMGKNVPVARTGKKVSSVQKMKDIEATERLLIRLSLHSAKIAEQVGELQYLFQTPLYREIFETILEAAKEADGGEIDRDRMEERLEDPERSTIAEIMQNVKLAEDTEVQFHEVETGIKRRALEASARELNELLSDPEIGEDVKERVMRELREVRMKINALRER
jgi:DNA primase